MFWYDKGREAALVKLGWSPRFNAWADAATNMDHAITKANKVPWGHAAVGAAAGGIGGYLSDDDNAARNAAIGAVGGGALTAGAKHLLNQRRIGAWEKVKETLVGYPTEEAWSAATKNTNDLANKIRGPF